MATRTQFSPAASSNSLEWKGKEPVMNTNTITPTAHMSFAGLTHPAYVSGAMYWSVPLDLDIAYVDVADVEE